MSTNEQSMSQELEKLAQQLEAGTVQPESPAEQPPAVRLRNIQDRATDREVRLGQIIDEALKDSAGGQTSEVAKLARIATTALLAIARRKIEEQRWGLFYQPLAKAGRAARVPGAQQNEAEQALRDQLYQLGAMAGEGAADSSEALAGLAVTGLEGLADLARDGLLARGWNVCSSSPNFERSGWVADKAVVKHETACSLLERSGWTREKGLPALVLLKGE